VIGVLILV
jgi:hypothetical protein